MDFSDELMARLCPLVDMFTDEELERMDQGDGPLVYCCWTPTDCPIGGVICDP